MNDSLPTSSGPAPSGVSRRTIVKGAAWAVPVVTLAGAAPAFAGASQCVPVPEIDIANSCKQAYEGRYKLVFSIGGAQCENVDCVLAITRIQEDTGQERTIWQEEVPVGEGLPGIIICDGSTYNMSNWIRVFGTITCGTQPIFQAPADGWRVRMPSWPSTSTCGPSDFSGCPPAAPVAP